jgi:hypothetical protein
MITIMHRPSSPSTRHLAVLGGMALCLGACAASPLADEKIAVADASVQRAEQSGAPQAAPVEFAAARDQLALARKANANHDGKPALDFAERADIDAKVAEATAQKQRAEKAAAEFDASMAALRTEAQRASPAVQPVQ